MLNRPKTLTNRFTLDCDDVNATNLSSQNIWTTNISGINLLVTNVSSGFLNVTNTLNASGNSNTLGNIFTTGGNVGIGTATPSQKLTVSGGNILLNSGSGTGRIVIQNVNTGYNIASDGLQLVHDGTAAYIAAYDSAPLRIIVNGGTPRMTINTSGNVGIGMSINNPAYRLDVTGDVRITAGSLLVSNISAASGIATIGTLLSTNFTSDSAYANSMTIGTLHVTDSSTFENIDIEKLIAERSTMANMWITRATADNFVVTTNCSINNLHGTNLHYTNITATNEIATNLTANNIRFNNLQTDGALLFNTTTGNLVIGIDNKTIKLDEANRQLYSDALSFVKGWDPITIYTADTLASYLGIPLSVLAALLGIPENFLPNFIFVKLNYDDQYFTTVSGKLTLTGSLNNGEILFKDNNILNGMTDLRADIASGTTTISSLKSLNANINNLIVSNSTFTNVKISEAEISYIDGDNIYYTNSTFTNTKISEAEITYIDGDNIYYTNSTFTNTKISEAEVTYIDGDNIYYTNSTFTNTKISEAEVTYIDGDNIYYTNSTFTNTKINEAEVTYIDGDNIYYTNSTFTNLKNNTATLGNIVVTNAWMNSSTINNLKSSEGDITYIDGTDIYYSNSTLNNLKNNSATIGSMLVNNAYFDNATIDNLRNTAATIVNAKLTNITAGNIYSDAFYITGATSPSSSNQVPSKQYVDYTSRLEAGRGISVSDREISIDIAATPITSGISISNDPFGNAKLIAIDAGLKAAIDQIVIANTIPVPNAVAAGLTNQLLIYLYIGVSVSLVAITASVSALSAEVGALKGIVDNLSGDVYATQGALLINPTKTINFQSGASITTLTAGSLITGNFTSSVGNGVLYFDGNLDTRSYNNTATLNLQSALAQTKIYSNADTKTYFQSSGDVIYAGIDSSTVRGLCITTAGNVGIGTATPSQRLTVSGGNILLNSGNATGRIVIQNVNTGYNIASDGLQLVHDGTAAYIGAYDSAPLRIIVNGGTTRMSINTSGNVGIGMSTNNPLYRLDVTGDVRITNGSLLVSSISAGSATATIGSIVSTNVNSTNITSTNLVTTGASATNLAFTTVSAGSATATIGTVVAGNLIATNLSTGTIRNAKSIAIGQDLYALNVPDPLAPLDIVANPSIGNAVAAFQDPLGGGFRHWITSRFYQGSNNGNALDFYLNTGNNKADSTAPGTGNQQVMTIAGLGVGIGITSPNYKLEINGNCKVTTDLYVGNPSAASTIYMGGGGAGDVGYEHSVIETRLYADSESTEMLLFKGNDIAGLYGPDRIRLRAGQIAFDTYDSPTTDRTTTNIRMLISESGNVGIGTMSPSGRLHIFDNSTGSSLRLTGLANNTESNTGIFFSNDNDINKSRFKTKILAVGEGGWGQSDLYFCLNNQNNNVDAQLSDTRMVITRGGNVGIGTTSPTVPLDVAGTFRSSSGNGAMLFDGNLDLRSANTYTTFNLQSSAAQTKIFSYTDNKTYFQSSGDVIYTGIDTVALRGLCIRTSGNVGIGTTSPSVQLHVEDGSIFVGDVGSGFSPTVPSAPGGNPTSNGYRLYFDNSYNGTPGTGVPANKIVIHNNNYTCGFGMEGTGLTYHSGYAHNFYTGSLSDYGTNTMNVNPTGVGIGTTSQNVQLTVRKPGISIADPISTGLVEFRGSQTSTVGESILRIGRGHHSGFFYAASAEFNVRRGYVSGSNAASALDIRLGAGQGDNPDTTVMTLLANGNVGIGTISPNYKLDINSLTTTNGNIILRNNNSGGCINFADNDHSIYGRVGLGGVTNVMEFHSNSEFRYYSGGAFTSQKARLKIGDDGTDTTMAWYFDQDTIGWRTCLYNDGDAYGFAFNYFAGPTNTGGYTGTGVKGFIDPYWNNSRMNFTGQHRSNFKDLDVTQIEKYVGLIVRSTGKYMGMNNEQMLSIGKDAISINESLPIVELVTTSKDKAVFGVVSDAEDPDKPRSDKFGCWGTPYNKESGDNRVHINSLGEGAIWVSNKNGNLENGDYITTCSIPGYGQKQNEEYLANYTVAKITTTCDFNPQLQPKMKPQKDENGDNILDNKGNIIWIESGEYEYEYDIRYIDNEGNILTSEEYDSNIHYKAAFVGCTYHCG